MLKEQLEDKNSPSYAIVFKYFLKLMVKKILTQRLQPRYQIC